MAKQKEAFCGRDLRKFLYVVGVIAVFIMIGSYWYTQYYEKGMGFDLWAVAAPDPTITAASPQGGAFVPAAGARPITVGSSPFRAVAAAMKPSVVNISAIRSTSTLKPAAMEQNKGQGLQFADPFSGVGMESIGSGIIITADGYILTNYHVVDKANQVYVTVFWLQGTTRLVAEIVRMSEQTDLALLKIEPAAPLRAAPLGDSEKLLVGDQILAIGSPFGLDQTVSQGIISSKRKSIVIEGIAHRNLLQADAAINQGNSGGPLVDLQGYVVGINTAIYTPTGAFAGVGFAVPINEAREFIEEVITLPKIKPKLKSALRLQARAGNVAGVRTAVGAIAPTIRAGAMNPHGNRGPCQNCHTIISPSANPPVSMQAAGNPPFTMNPGGAVGLNAARTTGVAPGKLGLGSSWFGAEVQKIDQVVARSFNTPVIDGVFVNSVYAGSPAETAGLNAGDIIFKIDGRRFSTADDLLKLVHSYKAGDAIRVSIIRNGKRRDLYLDIGGPPSVINPALGALPGAMAQTAKRPRQPFWGNAEAPTRLQAGAAPPPVPKEFSWLGMELEALALNEAANDPAFLGKKGALVVEISPGSPAVMAGLRSGDLILSINQTPVGTPEAINSAIWMSSRQNGSLLEIERSNRRMFVTIR